MSNHFTSDINSVTENKAELKRAFTIVPNTRVTKQSSELIYKSGSPRHGNSSELSKDAQRKGVVENWPDLEALEALIRGEQLQNPMDSINEIEQLELPLKFVEKAEQERYIIAPSLDDKIKNDNIKPEYFVPDSKYEVKAPLETNEIKAPFKVINEEKTFDITVSWGKIATAVASSIITGILIGYVLLLAVYGVNVWPISEINNKLTSDTHKTMTEDSPLAITHTDNQVTHPKGVGEEAKSSVPAQAEKIVIQPVQSFTYTVMQAGVFSKDDTKQAMVDSLKLKGYPAASIKNDDGKTVVIAGVASSHQATFQINHMEGVELYRKAFSLHIPKLSEDNLEEEQLQQWMFNVQDMMKSYMLMSEAQLEQTSFSAIYNDSFKLLTEKYNSILNESETITQSTTNEEIKQLIQWHSDELSAIQAQFVVYQEKSNLNPLLQVQQHLLNIISYQHNLNDN